MVLLALTHYEQGAAKAMRKLSKLGQTIEALQADREVEAAKDAISALKRAKYKLEIRPGHLAKVLRAAAGLGLGTAGYTFWLHGWQVALGALVAGVLGGWALGRRYT